MKHFINLIKPVNLWGSIWIFCSTLNFWFFINILKVWLLDIYYIAYISPQILKNLYFMLIIIMLAAYISLLERQIIGSLQQRFGPTLTGGFGALLQPIADGFKLMYKEIILPSKGKIFLYIIAPIYTFVFTLSLWSLVPVSSNPCIVILNKPYTILLILALFIIASYGPVIGGWASNNKFALLGTYRSIALAGSYGVTIGLVLCYPSIYAQSFNLLDIVIQQKKCGILPAGENFLSFLNIIIIEIKLLLYNILNFLLILIYDSSSGAILSIKSNDSPLDVLFACAGVVAAAAWIIYLLTRSLIPEKPNEVAPETETGISTDNSPIDIIVDSTPSVDDTSIPDIFLIDNFSTLFNLKGIFSIHIIIFYFWITYWRPNAKISNLLFEWNLTRNSRFWFYIIGLILEIFDFTVCFIWSWTMIFGFAYILAFLWLCLFSIFDWVFSWDRWNEFIGAIKRCTIMPPVDTLTAPSRFIPINSNFY